MTRRLIPEKLGRDARNERSKKKANRKKSGERGGAGEPRRLTTNDTSAFGQCD